MPTDSDNTLRVHVNIEISAITLKTIVANAKNIVGRDADGVYRVDTADMVSSMVTRFLKENDFEAYVQDVRNYDALETNH
jgi:hypothetical protein